MGHANPSLNVIFSNIGKKLLEEFFERNAPGLEFDWKSGENLPQRLFDAFSQIGDREQWSNCCTVLFDLNAICSGGSKTKVQTMLLNRLSAIKKKDAMFGDVGLDHSIFNVGMWIYLKLKDTLWSELVRDAVNREVEKGGGVWINYTDQQECDYASGIEAFKAWYIDFVKHENSHDTRIHDERNPIGAYNRYVMHIDPFPKNVGQFADRTEKNATKDGYKIDRDKNADSFAILDYPHQRRIKIKSEFDSAQANVIGE